MLDAFTHYSYIRVMTCKCNFPDFFLFTLYSYVMTQSKYTMSRSQDDTYKRHFDEISTTRRSTGDFCCIYCCFFFLRVCALEVFGFAEHRVPR